MSLIASDLYRFTKLEKNLKNVMVGLLCPGFRFMFFFRLASNKNIDPLRRFIGIFFRKLYELKYGFQIPIGTVIGRGFYIGHFGTIIVNEKATIGQNCNIAPGVVIGQANRGSQVGTPTIGNKVWMGVNSVIVGNISIGDDVLIAPLSYVNFDVPSHSIVIGNPGRIIEKQDATASYIINTV